MIIDDELIGTASEKQRQRHKNIYSHIPTGLLTRIECGMWVKPISLRFFVLWNFDLMRMLYLNVFSVPVSSSNVIFDCIRL